MCVVIKIIFLKILGEFGNSFEIVEWFFIFITTKLVEKEVRRNMSLF